MWTPNAMRALAPLILSYLLSTTQCIPLPDLTVLQCSSTIVEFAMQWHPGPSWNTRGINIDTACKSLDGSNVSYNINQACSLVTSCFQETTGCLIEVLNPDYAEVKLDSNQDPDCGQSTLMSLLQNLTAGYCANRIWIDDHRIGATEPLNETTIECSMPKPAPSPSVSEEVSFTGTTAGDVLPSDSALDDNLKDYIPVLVTLPVLFVFLTSVITVAVMVTVKVKCKQTAGVTVHTFTYQDKDFQASKFFSDIDPDERTVYETDIQSDYSEDICSFSSYSVQFTNNLGRECSEKHEQRASCQMEMRALDDVKGQTECAPAGGNYTTLHMTSQTHSLPQSAIATDSGVGLLSTYEEDHSVAAGIKVCVVGQKVPLNEKNECKISMPECSACDTFQAGASYITLNSVPA